MDDKAFWIVLGSLFAILAGGQLWGMGAGKRLEAKAKVAGWQLQTLVVQGLS